MRALKGSFNLFKIVQVIQHLRPLHTGPKIIQPQTLSPSQRNSQR